MKSRLRGIYSIGSLLIAIAFVTLGIQFWLFGLEGAGDNATRWLESVLAAAVVVVVVDRLAVLAGIVYADLMRTKDMATQFILSLVSNGMLLCVFGTLCAVYQPLADQSAAAMGVTPLVIKLLFGSVSFAFPFNHFVQKLEKKRA